MNILFLTMHNIKSIRSRGIYEDLMRDLIKNNHKVFIAAPVEKRFGEDTNIVDETNCKILRIKTGNLQKTSFIKKGIATLRITSQFKSAIKKYFGDVKFDLIIYSTPPITLDKVVEYLKKRDGAKTYLLLKDIFPQNAVDLGILSKSGIKGILYRFFRNKEKRLYALSDKIGCMSQANVDYVLKHNPEISQDKVEIFPNCIEIQDVSLSEEEKKQMRIKYDIPPDKKVFVYGGNLGKPQGIPFIIDCLRAEKDNPNVFFLFVGDGTEFFKLEKFQNDVHPSNFRLMKRMPKDDYDRMIASCDVGMIFLDHRFTIPNFPSRLLSYMQAGLPVLACTDPNTDIGKVIEEGGFGWWCSSDNVKEFSSLVLRILNDNNEYAKTEMEYLKNNFSVENRMFF